MSEIPLSTWAAIAEIIGAGSIVTGLVVGLFQVRQFRIQQRDSAAINLAQTFYSPDLARALRLLQNVPDGISLRELRERGEEYELAAITVCTSFETMGLLAHEGIAPMRLVMDLAGGIVSTMSRKLARWQEDLRAEQQQPSWAEWFEWLSDQASRAKADGEPAHIRYRDWRP